MDDEFIIRQPVSEERKNWLLSNYLSERQLTRTTEMVFDRVGALEMAQQPAIAERAREFGFRAIVFKHSFIDGVNSLIVSAQDWAIGQEDFLLHYLGENFRDAVGRNLGDDVDRSSSAILEACDEMAAGMRGQGLSPSAFVLTGSLGQPLYQELQGAFLSPSDWYWRRDVHPGRATHRFMGVHRDIPVVAIEAVRTPTLFAVDVARFATLTRFGSGPKFDPDFVVKAFDSDEAREVLTRQPNLILDPPPESGKDDERIRQLQLRVGLELWETYKLDVKDRSAVIARPLADPVYE